MRLVFLFVCLAGFGMVFSQNASARILPQVDSTCTLEGLKVATKAGENGTDVSVIFLLSRSPQVYFHYYDAAKRAIVFDFYDARIGESPLDSIHQAPITNSTVEYSKIDLNKDVAGLKADIRDIVRVSLYTDSPLDYDVQEDGGVITMSYPSVCTTCYSGRNKAQAGSRKSGQGSLHWKLPLVIIAAGLAGFGMDLLFFKN